MRTFLSFERRDVIANLIALRSAHNTLIAARDYLWLVRVDPERGSDDRIRPKAQADLEAYSILHLLALELHNELEGE